MTTNKPHQSPPTPNKKCISCQQDIPLNAHICCHCSNYQSKWKNELLYFSKIVTLISFVCGVLLYGVTKLPEIKKIIRWEDKIKIVGYYSGRGLVVANEGDGEVYITHVSIRNLENNPRKFSVTQKIDYLIKPKEIAQAPTDVEKGKNWKIVHGLGAEAWNKLWNLSKDRKCFNKGFLYQEDPYFLQIKSAYGKSLQTFAAEGSISYYSVATRKSFEQKFPIIGVFQKSTDPSCSQGPQEIPASPK